MTAADLQPASLRPGGTRRRAGRGLLRRSMGVVASVVTTVLGLLLVTFLIGRVVPIDPVLAVVGDRAPRDVYEKARLELGLDKPLWDQFGRYVGDVLSGDLGTSVLTSRPVLEDIARVFPATLELATLGVVIGILVGVPAGVMAAVHRGRWPDHLVRVVGLIGYSVPIFWRPRRPAPVLRQAQLGRRSRAARRLL